MIKITRLEVGIAEYMDNEIFSQVNTDSQVKKYGISVVSACAIKMISSTIKKVESNPIIGALGVLDGDEIDIEFFIETMKEKMPESGIKVQIPAIGTVTFNKYDIDLLESYIMKGGADNERRIEQNKE